MAIYVRCPAKDLIGALTWTNRLSGGRTCDGAAGFALDSAPGLPSKGPPPQLENIPRTYYTLPHDRPAPHPPAPPPPLGPAPPRHAALHTRPPARGLRSRPPQPRQPPHRGHARPGALDRTRMGHRPPQPRRRLPPHRRRQWPRPPALRHPATPRGSALVHGRGAAQRRHPPRHRRPAGPAGPHPRAPPASRRRRGRHTRPPPPPRPDPDTGRRRRAGGLKPLAHGPRA